MKQHMTNRKVLFAALASVFIAFSASTNAATLQNNNGGPVGVKKCTNTYHTGGTRCTTCTYSNYPEGTTVNCIKIKKPISRSTGKPTFGTTNTN